MMINIRILDMIPEARHTLRQATRQAGW